jgi:hypothetical protein
VGYLIFEAMKNRPVGVCLAGVPRATGYVFTAVKSFHSVISKAGMFNLRA